MIRRNITLFEKFKKILETKKLPSKKFYGKSIFNIPNPITFLRILITFGIIYMFFEKINLFYIILMFIFGMITDFFDGFFARKLHQVTEFGRQFDILADRFLLISTVGGIIITLVYQGLMNHWHLMQIFMILSREIISFPFALIALLERKRIPDARFIGKLTVFLQFITFPLIIGSIFYSFLNFSIYLSLITFVVGVFSALYYIKDLHLS